jgi:hypothetical protein
MMRFPAEEEDAADTVDELPEAELTETPEVTELTELAVLVGAVGETEVAVAVAELVAVAVAELADVGFPQINRMYFLAALGNFWSSTTVTSTGKNPAKQVVQV